MATSMKNRKIISDNIVRYCEKIGKERQQIANDLDVSYSTFTDWINGNSYPRIDRIEQMADYFNCRISDLIEEYVPGGDLSNEYYLNSEAAEIADFLRKSPEYKVLFDASRKVKPEDIDKVKQMIDLMRGPDTNEPA